MSAQRAERDEDQDGVSSHVDLQGGLVPEVKLGRLHRRASLLCQEEPKTTEKGQIISHYLPSALL